LKRSLNILAGLLWLLLPVLAAAQQALPDNGAAALESSAPYRVGEKLTYNITFASFPNAARAELFVADLGKFYDRDAVVLRAHLETSEVISAALLYLNNDYTAYVNPENGQPFRLEQVAHSGGFETLNEATDYTPFAGEFDFLSALYRFRALPLADKAVYSLNIRQDTERYRVQLRVLGRATAKTTLGSARVIVTELLPDNKNAAGYRPRIYFSDDERHVPVIIELQRRAGKITAELVGAEFIKRPNAPAGSVPQPPDADTSDDKPFRHSPQTVVNTSLPRGNNPSLGTLPFQLGEKLNYNVYLTRIKESVGQVTYEVRERGKHLNRDVLILSARAETTSALKFLFTAKDEVTSFVDPFTLLPLRTDMNLQEGKRNTQQQLNWDQDRGLVAILNGPRLEVPLGTHDYLSLFYALRSFNLTPPPNSRSVAKKTAVVLLVGNRPHIMSLEPLRSETIELGSQKVEAIQVKITVDDVNPDRYVMRLWISNDSRRLPLRLNVTLPQGVVRAELIIKPA
jgi:hypothetical protein